jgi:hypothetical protein
MVFDEGPSSRLSKVQQPAGSSRRVRVKQSGQNQNTERIKQKPMEVCGTSIAMTGKVGAYPVEGLVRWFDTVIGRFATRHMLRLGRLPEQHRETKPEL